MRRKLRQIFWFALLAALMIRAASSWCRTTAERLEIAQVDHPVFRSQTYLLEPNRWTEFSIPSSGTLLRVLTNANVMASVSAADEPQPSWPYAFTAQFVDQQGRILKESRFHCTTRLAKYLDPGSGQVFTSPFYTDQTLLACRTQESRFPLSQLDGKPVRVRVRLSECPPPIRDVGVRLYCRKEDPKYQQPHVWQRTSYRKRQKLARASVYTPDLLSPVERRNLLRWQWLPLAPHGIEGRDYERRVLLTMREIHGEELDNQADPPGQRVDNALHGIIPLPPFPGWARLEVRFSADEPPQGHPPELAVTWYGKGIHHRTQQVYSVRQDGEEIVFPIDAGMLRLESTHKLFVRTFWSAKAPSQETYSEEITPKPLRLLTYSANHSQPVEYDVLHVQQQSTPFRIVLRHLTLELPSASAESSPAVSCEFLDADGNTIAVRELASEKPRSVYDQAMSSNGSVPLTDSSKYHFSLDARIQRIRIRALTTPVLVAAYTRPSGLSKVTHVPQDYAAFHRDRGKRRSWFLVRASEHWSLQQEMRTQDVAVQSRPPEDDPDLLAGRYQWQDYHPQGAWVGAYLLTPRSSDQPFRTTAASTVYCQVEENHDHTVQLIAPPGRRQVQPSLLYCDEKVDGQNQPLEISVSIDGRVVEQRRVYGSRGEILLPPIPVNSSPIKLRLQTNRSARLLLNHIHGTEQPTFLKRLANRFDDAELSFDYEKQSAEDELLRLQFFANASLARRTPLQLSIEPTVERGLGPHRSWTFHQRVFEITPSGGVDVPVFGGPDQHVAESQTCFLPMSSDLPPGKYTIHVRQDSATRGYIVLSQTTPGADLRRRIFHEPHDTQQLAD